MMKKKHHDRAGINQDLNDADEEGIERHKQRRQPQETNDKAERAGDQVAIDDHGRAKDEHQGSEEIEQKWAH